MSEVVNRDKASVEGFGEGKIPWAAMEICIEVGEGDGNIFGADPLS